MSLIAGLLLLLPATVGAQDCDRSCEPRFRDVFGCCPANPTRRFFPVRMEATVPAIHVSASKGFSIMKTEVTQDLYQAVMAFNPSATPTCGGDCPVEQVSWCDAVIFANRLSIRDWRRPAYTLPDGFVPRLSDAQCDALAASVTLDPLSSGWRLPTQAEWDFAAAIPPDPPEPEAPEPGEGAIHPACTTPPNALGLCDMEWNVAEWVWDRNGAPSVRSATLGFRLVHDE